jgi:hypothetical protein
MSAAKLASVLLVAGWCVLPLTGQVRATGVAAAPAALVIQRVATEPSPEATYRTVLRRYCDPTASSCRRSRRSASAWFARVTPFG